MRDLIDRKAAIDAIDRFNVCGAVEENWVTLRDALQALPTAEQDWIPCSKQMPVEGVAIWVTIAGHDLIICKDGETIEDAVDRISKTRWVTQGFLGSDGWYGADGYPMKVRPIAWKPLEKPKAYEGEV